METTFRIENGVLTGYDGPGGDVTVPAGVTAVGDGAFRECADLRSLTLPKGLRRIGGKAFFGCTGLKRVLLPEGLASIGDEAFHGCISLPEVRLPEGLRRLGKKSLARCLSLTEVRLPGLLRAVPDSVLLGCRRLKRVLLPEGLTSIESYAFYGCASLEDPALPESLETVGRWAFSRCGGLRRVSLPPRVRELGTGAFASCAGLRRADLPEGLETVGLLAFAECPDLAELTLPESVKKVGEWAFRGCRGLADEKGFLVCRGCLVEYFGSERDLEIPEGVTRIGSEVFRPGPEPLRVRIPDSVERTDLSAFPRGDLVLRVRRWAPHLARAMRSSRLLALAVEEPGAVPPRLRGALRVGRVLYPGPAQDPEEARADAAWFSAHAASLLGAAFRLPELLRFLCENMLIRPGDADLYLSAARDANDPALTALLLDYADRLGMDKVEKARERRRKREEAAAEARARRLADRRPEEDPAGLRFALAGKPEGFSRAELRRRLEARGAKLDRAVTAGTDCLAACSPEDEPAAAETAAALGLPLLTWEQFSALLGLE